jgi:hypothetical protein
MKLFSSSQKKKTTSLVVDLQEESIGLAVVVVSNQEAPVVAHAKRWYLDPQEDLSNVLENTERLLDTSLRTFFKENLPILDTVHCVVHPVWYETYIRTARFTQEKKFTVTSRMLASLHEKEQDDIAEKEIGENDTIFKSHIAGVRINGYVAEQPIEKTKANSVEADIVVYSFHSELEKLFSGIIARHTPLPVVFIPFTTVAYTTIRDLFPHTENSLVSMVSAQLTELVSVQDGGIEAAANISLGRHTTIKELSLCLKQDIAKTFSILSMYDNQDLEEMSASDVSYCLQHIREKYLPRYIELFMLMSETVLSVNLFIISSSLLDTWFDELLSDALAAVKKTNTNQIHGILITPHLLHEYCEYAMHAKKDIHLMMTAMYINRFN